MCRHLFTLTCSNSIDSAGLGTGTDFTCKAHLLQYLSYYFDERDKQGNWKIPPGSPPVESVYIIDRFYKLRQKVQDNSRQPVRANIFLEDWKMGHILQFEDRVITNWKKHTGFVFNEYVQHLSSNCGMQNKYTLQVSGFLN